MKYGVCDYMKIYIWGTGTIAINYLKRNEIQAEELLGFIQTEKTKSVFLDKRVFEPQEIVDTEYDYIFVCVYYYGKEIYEKCMQVGIPQNKLIFVDNYEWIDGTARNKKIGAKSCTRKILANQNEDMVKEKFPQLFSIMQEQELEVSRYRVVMGNGYDLVEHDELLQLPAFSAIEYHIDYERYRTFELLANEIKQRNVEGEVAEVGVFKGTFAKLINATFSEKKFYLFDTFESFENQEFEEEVLKGRCTQNFREMFLGTSVQGVVDKMIYPELCFPRVGFFPDTAAGLEDTRFAFVSIDVDLEKSIFEALLFFYPRLNQGGAIFVHDYNNRFLEGVKDAVKGYEREIGQYLIKVPIADEGGTLIILK